MAFLRDKLSMFWLIALFCRLTLAWHYKIMDIGSEWPSWQSPSKLDMRGSNPKPHKPWLDLEQSPLQSPSFTRQDMWRKIFDWYPCNQKCTHTMLGCQWILLTNEISFKQAAYLKCVLYIYVLMSKMAPHFIGMFKIQISFSALSLLLSLPAVSAEWTKNTLSFCSLP